MDTIIQGVNAEVLWLIGAPGSGKSTILQCINGLYPIDQGRITVDDVDVLLRMLKGEGMTMVVVTHEIPFAREVGDRVAFFADGKICELGDARQVINNPQEVRTQRFWERVLH
ncbi:MAG: ATP-binding cassette domain-containing protein [Candidatus Competibacterales bacterium]